jgi:hypothetical protein
VSLDWAVLRRNCIEVALAIEPECPSITGEGRLTATDVLLVQDGPLWFAYVAAGFLRRGSKRKPLTVAQVRLAAFGGQVGTGSTGTVALVDLHFALARLAVRLKRQVAS